MSDYIANQAYNKGLEFCRPKTDNTGADPAVQTASGDLISLEKAQVWVCFVCLDMVSHHTNITSFLESAPEGGGDRQGRKVRRSESEREKIGRRESVKLF